MKRIRGFTILELLVVVAIIAILSAIAIPNFIGRIEQSKAARELAEIDAVAKAVNMYYSDKGVYPTLQGKDGTLLQMQPIEGAPHNVDFSSLVPDYLATLPHFSYWWVDYQGKIYHTENAIGKVTGTSFTPQTGYTFYLNGSTTALTGPATLGVTDYITGKDANGRALPRLTLAFKNEKEHPESTAGSVESTGSVLDLSGFASVVYVDTQSGSDSNTGTVSSPLKTVQSAISKVQSAGAIKLAAGTYTITNLTVTKNNVSIFGEGASTILTSNGLGTGMVGNENNITLAKLVLKNIGTDISWNTLNEITLRNVAMDAVGYLANSAYAKVKMYQSVVVNSADANGVFGDLLAGSYFENNVFVSRVRYEINNGSSYKNNVGTTASNLSGVTTGSGNLVMALTLDGTYRISNTTAWRGAGLNGEDLGVSGGKYAW